MLTLPATGSEMNGNSVVSREETHEKLAFGSDAVLPRFSILDPETPYSLPARQTTNGIVDAMVHVFEQYATKDVNTPLQDRQAEAVLATLIEEDPKVMANPTDYEARANVMWCAAHVLNRNLSSGVVQVWATHMIGHELTAVYGLDHAQTLAIVLPGVWWFKRDAKAKKVVQFGRRVLGVTADDENAAFEETVSATEAFW
ncbi:MAG: iron-containing alcohol dehydrogenase, partial [Spirochaetota bacterium]